MESMYRYVKTVVKTKTTSKKRCTTLKWVQSPWWRFVFVDVAADAISYIYMISDFIETNPVHTHSTCDHCVESQLSIDQQFQADKGWMLQKHLCFFVPPSFIQEMFFHIKKINAPQNMLIRGK